MSLYTYITCPIGGPGRTHLSLLCDPGYVTLDLLVVQDTVALLELGLVPH